ncbi:MAG TPA: hypothetical protein PLP27_12805 [Crocinitomicaceae bacterium]|nr:hypothetical protein [Crocinitomicaceae bacterium]
MTKIVDKELNIELQVKAIELLNSSIKLPANPNKPITNFNFNIEIESSFDAPNKLFFVIVHVEVKDDDQFILGALSVSCIFEIANFSDVVKVQADGKIDMPSKLIETLNFISISTTRGVMFSTFRGTFLHGAFLPIIDPKQFQLGIQK